MPNSGGGNNGIVYLARQLTLDREVALKLLLPELAAEPEYTRSILREARLAARLDHPNIVQALDAGSSPDGFCFFAMEYVPGRTLEDIRIHHPEELSFRFLLDLSIQLADALAYAWKHCRMIHGDIKPGNLLIRDGDRRLKLADLGLARISGVPGADEIVVTPLYAAPEVIRGEFAKVGQTSDIYSFGVMFYELAAGKPPFRGDTDFLIDAHQNLPPPPLWEANPDIDPELAGFVMQMLEKEPEHRPRRLEGGRRFSAGNPRPALLARLRGETAGAAESTGRPPQPPPPAAHAAVGRGVRLDLSASGGVLLHRLPVPHRGYDAHADHHHAGAAGGTAPRRRCGCPGRALESRSLRRSGA